MKAFMIGEANRGKEMMVFDWLKAAQLIVERKPSEARAGLQSDWEWTGGSIFADGKIIPKDETYTFLASTWATPELELDGEVMDCFRMESEVPGWDAYTYWPDEAMAILIQKSAS